MYDAYCGQSSHQRIGVLTRMMVTVLMTNDDQWRNIMTNNNNNNGLPMPVMTPTIATAANGVLPT